MDHNIKEITDVLEEWLEQQLGDNRSVPVTSKENINVNTSLLLLQNWLIDWQEKRKINQRVNAAIISENIIKQSHSRFVHDAFREIDYQFNFLDFLALNFASKQTLWEYIDKFIDEHKEQLTLADIVITDTGPTRAKTNLRFALNALRSMGMIESRDTDGKRSLRPSFVGLSVLINVILNKVYLEKNVKGYKVQGYFKPVEYPLGLKFFDFDPTLYNSLMLLDKREQMTCFLDHLANFKLTGKEYDVLIDLIKRIIGIAKKCVNDCKTSIHFIHPFDNSSKVFQKYLWEQSKQHENLSEKLTNIYKELRK